MRRIRKHEAVPIVGRTVIAIELISFRRETAPNYGRTDSRLYCPEGLRHWFQVSNGCATQYETKKILLFALNLPPTFSDTLKLSRSFVSSSVALSHKATANRTASYCFPSHVVASLPSVSNPFSCSPDSCRTRCKHRRRRLGSLCHCRSANK